MQLKIHQGCRVFPTLSDLPSKTNVTSNLGQREQEVKTLTKINHFHPLEFLPSGQH